MSRILPTAIIIAIFAGCSPPPTPPVPPSDPPAARLGINNLQSVGAGLWSGSVPEGDAGFETLRNLGVKTIVSVDGTIPEVERAKRFGMRYVHLPVGYGGITHEQELKLARAAELPGPIYVHCHHGQHRGPTAAALMNRCRAHGWTADDALAFLKVAGTDPKYEGLYKAVREFRPPTADELKAVPNTFPEVAEVGGFTARMVEIDDLWSALKRARANEWKAIGKADAIASLALQLREGFREAARLSGSESHPDMFRQLLASAELAAAELETAIRDNDINKINKSFDRSAAICTACHREFRDRRP